LLKENQLFLELAAEANAAVHAIFLQGFAGKSRKFVSVLLHLVLSYGCATRYLSR